MKKRLNLQNHQYLKMLKKLYFLTLLLFVVSCNEKNKNTHPKFEDFSEEIKIKNVKLNTDGGYKNNQIFDRPIDYSSYVKGSKTGVYLPLIGDTIRRFHHEKINPEFIHKKNPLNLHKIKKNEHYNVSFLNEDSLKKVYLTDIKKSQFVIHPDGKKVPWGTPYKIKNKKRIYPDEPTIKKALDLDLNEQVTNFIQYYTVENGLVDADIVDIIRDKDDNVWIATEKGISKFDGEYFYNYSQDNVPVSRIITKLFLDSKGNIWIGTKENGVMKYDGNGFINFTTEDGLSSDTIRDIAEDKKGNIWFATERGLCSFHNNSFTNYGTIFYDFLIRKLKIDLDYKKSLLYVNKNTLAVEIDKYNNLWISSYTLGLIKFDGKSFSLIRSDDGLLNNSPMSLLSDQKGNLWIGYDNGALSKFDGKKFISYNDSSGIISKNATILNMDLGSNDAIWLASQNSGYRFKHKEIMSMDKQSGLRSNVVTSILDNANGVVFLGNKKHGLAIYKEKNFKTLKKRNKLLAHDISDVQMGKDGSLWISYWGRSKKESGFAKISNDSITNFGISEHVKCVYEDDNGNVFIGTESDGFYLFDGLSFYRYYMYYNVNLANGDGLIPTISSFAHADEESVWITSNMGLYKFNWKNNLLLKYKGVDISEGSASVVDANGNVWIASEGAGVYKIKGDSIIQYTEKEGLANNWVSSISASKNSGVWFCTESGEVSKFDNNRFVHFYNLPNPIGDSDSSILFVQEDSSGNIWFANLYDLYSFDFKNKDPLSITKPTDIKVSYYNYKDGFSHDFMNSDNAVIDEKNNLFMASSGGLTKFQIPNNKERKVVAAPKLVDLKINNKSYSYTSQNKKKFQGFYFSKKIPFYNVPLGLVLNHDYNQLTFNFTSIDWSSQHKLKYAYKIEGYDDKWNITNQTIANYRNLPSGKYTLKVIAIGENTLSSEALEFTFTILPPWYLTFWAKIIYALLGLGIIYLIIYIRTLSLKKRQKELEIQVDKATRDNINLSNVMIEQEKLILAGEIAGTVAHELNTPLAAIVASTKGLQENYLLSSELLKSSSKDDIDFAFNLNFDFSFYIFKSGREAHKLKKGIYNQLMETYNLQEDQAAILSEWFFKSRIDVNNSKTIKYILDSTNPIDLLKLITAIANTKYFLSTALESSNKSALVVQEIKESIDINSNQKNSRINLKKNILTVVKLFSHEIKDSAELIIDIEEGVYILGWDFKLYQLWSNLIKNAIYAVNEKNENRKIKIYSKLNADKVDVIIENNGPKIPDELSDKIFDKFYTTKKDRGSGLGLGIVQGVVEAHQAEIDFFSEESKTQFKVTFSCIEK